MSTVLVVDDSQTELELLSRYLQQAGLTVVTATSSEEAQIKLTQQKPDLIVLDVILPGRSGFELCCELKGNQATDAIPVVICSTKNTDADKMWGTMLGADAYLPKPIDHRDLLQTVQTLLGGR